jgi:thiamine pyrophosphate-dependent acetolactate synthase large subunit-like protein
VAQAFEMRAEQVAADTDIEAALQRGLAAQEPYLIEFLTRLPAVAPRGE